MLYNRYARPAPYAELARQSRNLAKKLWLSRIVYSGMPESENPTMEDFTTGERKFANLTVVFYFFVALIMWIAIAVLP